MNKISTEARPATLVPESRRMEFLPGLFGCKLMLVGERTVYQPLFLSPDTEKRFRISCETNGYQGEVSAEAAGIIATLFALSHLSFQHEADQLADGYARLYVFAGDHPEAGEIFAAID